MIVEGLFELVYTLLSVVLTPFQIIPNMPSSISNQIDNFVTFIFQPIDICLYFFDIYFLRAAIPIILIIVNMEHIWDGILWILKKLPFVGIE